MPGVCASGETQLKLVGRCLGKSGGGGVTGFDMPVVTTCDKSKLDKDSV